MTVRPFRDEDRKFLDNVSRETGYPYPNVDDHLTECIMIAEENGKPVAALLARRARCRRRALVCVVRAKSLEASRHAYAETKRIAMEEGL